MEQSTSRKSKQSGASNCPAALGKRILQRARTPQFKKYLQNLLIELCKVDTTPNPDISVMRAAEAKCFAILERELAAMKFPGGTMERKPVNPQISKHKNYSLLHFTKTARRPKGLTAKEAYKGRTNLVCVFPGSNKGAGKSLALDAHVDVVAPYFPPTVKGDLVLGRGACDDKGPAVSLLAAFKLLSDVLGEKGLALNRNVLGFFVVEEETGGNGSLSLAMDRKLKKLYESVVVCECASLNIYPANRGAVWYKTVLGKPAKGSLLELASFVIEELEKEGASIRAESRHKLFPQRPVQTCHGIIGPFGEHPSRICGKVAFTIHFQKPVSAETETLVQDCLDFGLASYVGLYGDKTKVTDVATGRPMVARHFTATRKGRSITVEVFGATGHMGAIRERDGAITKMSHLVRSLVYSRARIESSAGRMELQLAGKPDGKSLVLEGGQGFVPTHRIEDVMDRMRRAAQRGAASYLLRLGLPAKAASVEMTYEKLHNVAFDGDPDSYSMRNAIASARECGIWKEQPVLGWTVSCDSRLFATEYPGMEVLTVGPGELVYAHSDQEQIRMEDVVRGAEFLALLIARQAGVSPA